MPRHLRTRDPDGKIARFGSAVCVMDSITHMALGAALGEATLSRKLGNRAALWGAGIATFPDLDVLIRYGDPVADFIYHRSFTHSVVILTLLAPLFALLILRIHRMPRSDYPLCLLFCWLTLCTHALLDAVTVYGTQLFWPFGEMTVMWSSIFIVDPAFTLPLLIGLGLTFTMIRRQRRQYGRADTTVRPRLPNLLGLAVSTLYLTWTFAAKAQVDNAVQAELEHRNIEAQAVLTVPAPATTLLWRIVVMTDEHYYEGFRSLLDRSDRIRLDRYPGRPDLITDLQEHWPVEKLQWFSHGFHAASLEGDAIVMTDLRMGQEPVYVFQFQVGEQRHGTALPVQARQRPMRLDLASLPWVWHRIWDEALPPL